MKLVKDVAKLIQPHICSICETSLHDAKQFIDTEAAHDGFCNLDGQKYVCDKCGAAIAKLLGFGLPGKELEAAKAKIAEFEKYFKELHDFAVGLADITK